MFNTLLRYYSNVIKDTMMNEYNKSLAVSNNEPMLSIESTAAFLGISIATVRNWVKCGYLQIYRRNAAYLFYKKDIEEVKAGILNGNLDKLNKRANKIKADRYFIPDEYIQNKAELEKLNSIIHFIQNNSVDIFLALFLIGLNLLKKEKIASSAVSISDVIQRKDLLIANKQIKEEVESWLSEISKEKIKEVFSFLLDCDVPKQCDILGFLYQTFLTEGQKSQNGLYYTPSNIVDEVVYEYVKEDSKVLDPCCGTGQFLLAFANVVKDPTNIYGIDLDPFAVRIARFNILVKFKDKHFVPNIFCKNTLLDIRDNDLFVSRDGYIGKFDVIATNPPWGFHFSKTDSENLKKLYPAIKSSESFSYFLRKSIDLLGRNGLVSFILPESILSVKTHKDIREIILKNHRIEKIVYLNRIFRNVFTPVVRLDLAKIKNENYKVKIQKSSKSYVTEQKRWLNNQDFVFDIHTNPLDIEIMDKVYKIKNTTLKNKADWALGIVTGNNQRFISSGKKGETFEPIYRGKDVERFVLSSPSSFVQFTPEKFQQVAPERKYRISEKLIYRFISKYLVFAYDNRQRLTLNSANIVIPKLPDYPIKVVAALFNSSLYQFIFQKRFSSIKVLRGHIEQMPLPLWDKTVFSKITKLVNETIEDKGTFEELDNYIMDQLSLSLEEKNYVKRFSK